MGNCGTVLGMTPKKIVAALVGLLTLTLNTTAARAVTPTTATYTYDTTGDTLAATYRPGLHDQQWVMTIHGGGWDSGSPASVQPAVDVYSAAGYAVFNIAYPLANGTTVHWPEQLAAVEDARDWIRTHASTFGINPDQGAIYGFSAGGMIAATVGLQGQGITAIVTASGVLQPQRIQDDLATQAHPEDFPLTAKEIQTANSEAETVGCGYTDTTPTCVAAWQAFEPQTYITPTSPPIWMNVGDADAAVPYRQDGAFGYWMHQQTRTATTTVVPGLDHTPVVLFDGATRQAAMLSFVHTQTVAP